MASNIDILLDKSSGLLLGGSAPAGVLPAFTRNDVYPFRIRVLERNADGSYTDAALSSPSFSLGIGNIDAILEVPRISAIVPGPFDLSQAMGHAGDMRHPDVVKALRTLTTKARAKGVDTVAVLLSNDAAGMKEEMAFWKDLDTTIFWAGGDRRMFTLALRNRMAQVRENL